MKEEELKEGGKPLTVRLRIPYTGGVEIEERIQKIVEKSATLKDLKYYITKDNCDVNSGGQKVGAWMNEIKADTKLCLYVAKEVTHEISYEIKGGQLMKKVKGGDAVAVKEDEIKNEDVHNIFWQETEVLASGKLVMKQFTDKQTGQEDIWKALIEDNKLYGYKVNEIEALTAGGKKQVNADSSTIDISKVEKLTALIKADKGRLVQKPKTKVVTELGKEPAGQPHLTVPGQLPGETHNEIKSFSGIIYIGAYNTGTLLKEKIRAIGGADEKQWRSIEYIYRVSSFSSTRWDIEETKITSASDLNIIEAYDKKYKDPRFGRSDASSEPGHTRSISKSFATSVEGTEFKYEHVHKVNSFSGTKDTFTRYVTLQGQPGYFQRPMTQEEIQKVFGPGGLREQWEKGFKILANDFVKIMGALVSSTIEAAKQAQAAQQGQGALPGASSQGTGPSQLAAPQTAQTGHGGIGSTIAKKAAKVAAKEGFKFAKDKINENGGIENVFGNFLGGGEESEGEGGLGSFFE
ncbi:hypothetical protein Ddc_16483 [Ditylenchus destructor]|nr:hypothetical protein Ddc_16483 [Ditylenchus destructor]